MLEIMSIGDANFLVEILNGVAMLAGSADIQRSASTAFILGLLFIGFQSVVSGGQRIELQKPLIGIVIYMIAFGSTVTDQR